MPPVRGPLGNRLDRQNQGSALNPPGSFAPWTLTKGTAFGIHRFGLWVGKSVRQTLRGSPCSSATSEAAANTAAESSSPPATP